MTDQLPTKGTTKDQLSPYAAWYVIAWRLPWFALIQVLRVLTTVVAFCGYGKHQALRTWRDMR